MSINNIEIQDDLGNSYYPKTKSTIVMMNDGSTLENKMANHGNHIPAPQTANNKVFLRNDNTWQTLPSATTSATGIVQLNDATNSTSTTQAATANAVKKACDLANSKAESSHTHSNYVLTSNGGSTTIHADSNASSTSEHTLIKAGHNELKVSSSAGGSTVTKEQDKLTFNGNVIYHEGNKPSKSDIGLSNVQNWTATSDTNDSSTSKYATAAGVKAAYDKANSAYTLASNSPSLYTYECDFSSSTVYDITLPSGLTRSNVIIVGAMMMNSTNTDIDRPLIVGMDIATAPLPPGTADNKFSFYYTGGTINQKVRVVIMKVGNLYR